MLRWHSGTQKRGGRTKQRDQIENEARLFWKSIAKTKHQSLTSLAFIRLVPGADRAVRHICIRCMHRNIGTHATLFLWSKWLAAWITGACAQRRRRRTFSALTTTTTNDVAQHGGHPANTKPCSTSLLLSNCTS